MPDAITLLKDDHRRGRRPVRRLRKGQGRRPQAEVGRADLRRADRHAQIEEEIFYPACEGAVDEDDIKEAYVEHDGAKVLIAEISAGGPDDDYCEAKVKVKVLQEQIEHHVKEEESRLNGIFAQARRHGVDLDALGEELAARQQELMAGIEKNGLPKVKLATMDEVKV